MDPTISGGSDDGWPEGQATHSDGDGDDNAAPSESPGHLGESARIGRFAVLRQLGAGGMGVVYSAYDEELDRKIALKLLRPGRDNSARNQARMQREARAMATLSHPNVVQVYEVGRFEDQVYVAMEFVQGKTLGAWLKAQERSWPEILNVMVQAGRGLQAAHDAGVIHADFKPDNVLITAEDRVRVVDFGLSRRAETASASQRAAAPAGEPGRSQTGPAATGGGESSQARAVSLELKRKSELDESGRLRPGEEPRSNARIAGTPAYM